MSKSPCINIKGYITTVQTRWNIFSTNVNHSSHGDVLKLSYYKGYKKRLQKKKKVKENKGLWTPSSGCSLVTTH